MAWVKIDDQFADHPKIIEAGPLAGWLYVCGLTYCARYLTDGVIPVAQVGRLTSIARVKPIVAALVRSGLWTEVVGETSSTRNEVVAYSVHDYLDYNPSSDQVRNERKQAQQRMKALRSGEHAPNKQRSSDDVRSPRPVPSRPDPLPTLSESPRNTGVSKLPTRMRAREEIFSPSNPTLTDTELVTDAAACGTTADVYASYVPQWSDKRKGNGKPSADWRADLRGFVRAALEIKAVRGSPNGHDRKTWQELKADAIDRAILAMDTEGSDGA